MQNKITWLSINITPGTEFMKTLNDALKSLQFRTSINNICKNLEAYILSGSDEPAEGENKIIHYLRSLKNPKGKFVFFSPDGDVTLLSLIASTALPSGHHIPNLSILRHNQQMNNYAVIDIQKLASNIYSHVLKQVNLPERDRVIKDIVLLLSIFGNDFIPKIVSLDIRYDFKRLIDIYTTVLKSNNKHHLISHNGQKYIINQDVFLSIFKILKKDEGKNLQKTYMSNNYINYERLKNIMGADHANFTQVLNDFLSNLRKFNGEIKNMTESNIDDFVNKWTKKDKESFIKKLKKLTKMGMDTRNMNDDDFIHAYIEYYERQNKIPYIAINFVKRSKSIKDRYHQMKLDKKLDYIDPKLKITPYDKEIYKLDNMLDEYAKKLNAQELDFGYIGLDTRTYTFKSEKISKGVSRYYKTFFDIDNLEGKKMDDLVQNYLDGFIYVFEQYYNHYDIEFHRHNANTWFYPYTHSPLTTQIYKHLEKNDKDKNYIKKISDRLNKYWVDRSEFFNSLEQLMYVSPVQHIPSIVPVEYKSFVKTSKHYSDLNKVVKSIMSDIKSDEIDCIGARYSSKCHFAVVRMDNFDKDKEFIQQLRKIKLSKETARLRGKYDPKKSNINIFVINKKALSRPNTTNYYALYQDYKQKYKETGHSAYKKIYKYIKHNLLK
uniref:XRN 5'-3' exonuclease n=1 Tax=Mimivirus LCMiAC01 TaxID=2506608 RepID=A0A481YZF1_9VIRU|nr:MAG: XRN 5'-3' exonuclease [Mimivirus LCMiAC01]